MIRAYVKLADTPLSREYGLKNVKNMSKNAGMLFKFPYKTRLSFWMQDTYIPLDIAFIDDDGEIVQISEMQPLNLRPVVASRQCRYALEMNKGWFKDNGVEIGSKISGRGFHFKKLAQMEDPMAAPPMDAPPMDAPMGGDPAGDVENPEQQQEERQPSPDVELNKSFKEMIEDANLRGEDLLIMYQTKYGQVTGPRRISPPFLFEPDEDDNRDAIVKAWDNQMADWRSYLIDNILEMEKPEQN